MADDIESNDEPPDPDDYEDEFPAEPDVLLDVPRLTVEEIVLDVEELHARVSVQADVLDLVKLHVGVDAELSGVHLEIRGVDAQVLLKARLERVAEIIGRALTTVERLPQLLGQTVPNVEPAEESEEVAPADTGGAGAVEGAGDVVGQGVEGVGKILDTSGRLVDKVLGGSGSARRTTATGTDRSDEGGGTRRKREQEENPP